MIIVIYNNNYHLLIKVLQLEYFNLIFYIDLLFQIIIIRL